MAMLDSLLESVKNQIVDHVQQGNHSNFDTDGLLGKITNIFNQHRANNVRPASDDPYGDPADTIGRRH